MKGKTIRVSPAKQQMRVMQSPQESVAHGPILSLRSFSHDRKSNKSLACSNRKDTLISIEPTSGVLRGRTIMEEHLHDIFAEISELVYSQERQEIETMIKEVSAVIEFDDYAAQYFPCYNRCYQLMMRERNREVFRIPLDLKLKKKVLLAKQSEKSRKSSRGEQLGMVLQENQQLKKQLFRLKESTIGLERRILHLISQYKERKHIYLSEIQRLATIVNTTIQDIPYLILQPHSEKRAQYDQKHLLPPSPLLVHKDSEYNTYSTEDALRRGLQSTYKIMGSGEAEGARSIRSQESITFNPMQ